MAEERQSEKYRNQLTLEAQIFLDALEKLGKNCNEIDSVLSEKLWNITVAIDSFVSRPLQEVTQSERIYVLENSDLEHISRLYHCDKCKRIVGNAARACLHLQKGHGPAPGEVAQKPTRKEKKRKRDSKALELPKKANSLFSADLKQFYIENVRIAEKLRCIPEYDVIERNLLELLKPIIPEKPIQIYKFGSRISGIGTCNSDLDIFVDIGNVFHTFENHGSTQTLTNLRLVRKSLLNCKKVWAQPQSVENARVPIIKTRHIPTGIECDLSFCNALGFCNSQLMQYLLELQPMAQRMCLFMKRWRERTKTTAITNYNITLMVIFFLQVHNYLPSIEKLQQAAGVFIGPWMANFTKRPLSDFEISELKVSTSEWQQFQSNFFDYYAKFKYAEHIICPYLGRVLKKKDVPSAMPKRLIDYVKSEENGKAMVTELELNKPVVVQDPIQLNHNVAKAVSASQLKTIVSYFELSASKLILPN